MFFVIALQQWRDQEREKARLAQLLADQKRERDEERSAFEAMWGARPEEETTDGKQTKSTWEENLYEGLLDKDELRQRKLREEQADPFMSPSPAGSVDSFREMFTRGMERTRESWSEMKTATPFSYRAQSFKHGIWTSKETRVSVFWVSALIGLFLVLVVLDVKEDSPDCYHKTVITVKHSSQPS